MRLFVCLHFPSVSALSLSISSLCAVQRILVNPLTLSRKMHIGEHYALECLGKPIVLNIQTYWSFRRCVIHKAAYNEPCKCDIFFIYSPSPSAEHTMLLYNDERGRESVVWHKGSCFFSSSSPLHWTRLRQPCRFKPGGHPYRLLNAKNKRVARSRGEGNGGKANAHGLSLSRSLSLSLSFLLREWMNWVVRIKYKETRLRLDDQTRLIFDLCSMVGVCICTFSAKTTVGRLIPSFETLQKA